jgi:hypothetical protein
MESPGPKSEALVAYLDHHLITLDEVEPFFLCIVQMAHRSALRNIAMLYQKEPAWVSLVRTLKSRCVPARGP